MPKCWDNWVPVEIACPLGPGALFALNIAQVYTRSDIGRPFSVAKMNASPNIRYQAEYSYAKKHALCLQNCLYATLARGNQEFVD